MNIKKRVLFCLKRRDDFNPEIHTTNGMQTGLYNSAQFVFNMLKQNNVECEFKVLVDYNSIDKEVTKYKPTHVIIEALWVTPNKFIELVNLHPHVTWVVRLHSEIPFIANEGIAMDWIGDYSLIRNIVVACNSPRSLRDIRNYIKIKNNWTDKTTNKKIIYLPNYYKLDYNQKKIKKSDQYIDIGCFGAVRPFKNHLTQALAAIEFAESQGKKLRFHINASRVEQKGQPVLNNLKALFVQMHEQGHHLIMHDWMERDEFLSVCARMDIGLQVSFSETFNIVGADVVNASTPIVGSNEIPWTINLFCANPVDIKSVVRKLKLSYNVSKLNVWLHRISLFLYSIHVKNIWIKTFN